MISGQSTNAACPRGSEPLAPQDGVLAAVVRRLGMALVLSCLGASTLGCGPEPNDQARTRSPDNGTGRSADRQTAGAPPAGTARDRRVAFLRLMNRGKAHLEIGEYREAIECFTAARQLRPGSLVALRNLGRTYLFSGDLDRALQWLAQAEDADPESAATAYLLGLISARQSRFESAIGHFEKAARLDPVTAAIRFQLASAYEAEGRDDQAREQYQETVRLDPQHREAQFRLAMQARERRETDEYRKRLREFERLGHLDGDTSAPPLALEACVHTRAEPPLSEGQGEAAGAPAPEIEVRYRDTTDDVFNNDADRSAACLAIIDMDDHGRYTLFVVDQNGGASLMRWSPAGKFERQRLPLQLGEGLEAPRCLIGNYHDDASEDGWYTGLHRLEDVLVVDPRKAYLLKRTDGGEFLDVTDTAGLASLRGRDARWVDYEYDGDLDLLVAGETGLQLWQNNGDGKFQNVTAEVGIAPTHSCTAAEAVDLDTNGGVDFIVSRGNEPTLVYRNRRAGRFEPMPAPPGPWPVARHVLVNDINLDRHPDVLLVGPAQATILFGQSAVRQSIDLSDFRVAQGTLFDYDNDGWLDFCAVGSDLSEPSRGEMRVWRNTGAEHWADVTAELALETITVGGLRDVTAADFDADGDSDLLLVSNTSQLHFLRNDGGHVHGQLKVRLASLTTNRSGIGTHIELRAGEFWVTRTVQKEWPIEIGLRGHKKLDSVQTVWTNGVVDNRIDVSAMGEPLDIVIVKWVVTGSCPYLYAWDGRGYRFITDVVGGGALGLPLSREAVWPANPHEIVLIGSHDQFRPNHDGAYALKLANELREVDYLDRCTVVAVDHPRQIEVHSTDKFVLPPHTPSQLWALADPVPPRRAGGDDGIDRTDDLQDIDGIFAPPGPRLPPPLHGVCLPMTLTLDFGTLRADRPLVLALTGWLEYGNASSNIALSQNSAAKIIWPTLEAETADGRWRLLDVTVGLPAGKTKTILCDLAGRIPRGARRLRLTTTFEVRWDRIALFDRETLDKVQIRELVLDRAELGWRGFASLQSCGPRHPMTPIYDRVFDRPPWRTTVEGWCTRYGDVRELIAREDGRLVILNSGDVLTLQCSRENLPPVGPGMTRTFFLSSVGWDKEDNANTVDGETVEPLPGDSGVTHAPWMDEEIDWRIRYNTRWVPRHAFTPRRAREKGSDPFLTTRGGGMKQLPQSDG